MQQTKKVVSHVLQYKQSYKCLEQTSKLLNSTPGAKCHTPTTTYKIKKMINPSISTEFHLKCSNCKTFTPTTSTETVCDLCNQVLKRTDCKYFVYMSFKTQLEEIVLRHFDEIMQYKESFNNSISDAITDVQDGIEFKKIQIKYKDFFVLPLTVNTDGIKVFNSTSKSLWPIQVCLNFLSPKIRYIPENVLLVALHEGKPENITDFFYPFLKELKVIKDNDGMKIEKNGKQIKFLPLIISCTADLPAKAEIQGMIGHNGHFGCGYCLHPGVLIKKNSASKSVVRFVARENQARTHDDTLKTYLKLKSANGSVNGIKSMSCMVAADAFDVIEGFSIDYLHFGLLGVVKKHMDLWTNSKNHTEPYYISKKRQVELSNRIVRISPLAEITRKPRSIFQMADFKANEFRTLSLYYLRYCLIDLLPMRYINHFQLFSSAIYMLLQEKVSKDDICTADKRLNEFADKFEILYGKHNVTMNLHLSRHAAKRVEHLGPLWAQSAFVFETKNGDINRLNNAKHSILHNISWKYTAKSALKEKLGTTEKCICLGAKTTIRLDSSEISELIENELEMDCKILIIYKFITMNGIKITSLNSKIISTTDYFVRLTTGEMGAINFFVVKNNNVYAIINMYTIENTTDHLMEVKPKNVSQIFNVKNIKEKLLFMKIGKYEIATKIANRFEKT